jgi:hypothetical protein
MDEVRSVAFFSIDVVGSTEYKAKRHLALDYAAHWARFFESFVADFPIKFRKAIDVRWTEGETQPPEPEVWKLLGDEILFSWPVTSFTTLVQVCFAFYDALVDYDQAINEKFGLRAKGIAWIASFPIRNARIPIDGLARVEDFIGPDIDAGFRLAGHTRAGRLAVSMDLADVLAAQSPLGNFRFCHVGWAILKGVNGNQPYPVIWVRNAARPGLVLPWDGYDCDYTRRFLAEGGAEKHPDELISMIDQIRRSLPELKLIRPYLDAATMPIEHRHILERWQARASEEAAYGRAGNEDAAEATSE